MPVTLYFKSPLRCNKFPACVTSLGFRVLPQHELVVCGGHQYHCRSELSLPQYFWPAVCNPSALSFSLSLFMDTWLHTLRFKLEPMYQISYMGIGQISHQQQQL